MYVLQTEEETIIRAGEKKDGNSSSIFSEFLAEFCLTHPVYCNFCQCHSVGHVS